MGGHNTFLFTWNPIKWKWSDLPQAVDQAKGGRCHLRWVSGAGKSMSAGDRAFMMRLGLRPKGIMGSGVIISEQWRDRHWDIKKAERGYTANFVEISIDFLSESPLITKETLESGILQEFNWYPHVPGNRIPKRIANELEKSWSKITGYVFNPFAFEERENLSIESRNTSSTNAFYEENPRECLREKGQSCLACRLELCVFR